MKSHESNRPKKILKSRLAPCRPASEKRWFPSKVFLLGLATTLLALSAGFYLFPQAFTQETAALPTPAISAGQAILLDADTGKVLYEKNADKKAYPASTTKIMTALLTIQRVEELKSDLTQQVKIPAEAVGVEGSSIYLAPQEPVTIEDLLYGMMLRSGNDAATALASIIGGDQDHFMAMMNSKAQELGCTNTHFVNPSGLFDENHYTTAEDMGRIALAAMKNPTFRRIAAAEKWTASRAPDKYNYFYNKNKVVHQYKGGNGIKIGYTKASGRTLVASARRDGRQLVCVVMSAPDWFNDSYKLMDYGFSLKP